MGAPGLGTDILCIVHAMAFNDPSPSPLSSLSLPLGKRLTPPQLTSINVHLDQLLLALYALTDLDEATWQGALQQVSGGDVTLDLNAMNPVEQVQGLRPQAVNLLDVESIRALVGVISYLTQQYQELLRRSVTLAEQTIAQGKDPFQTILLGNYGKKLRHLAQSYCAKHPQAGATLTNDRILSLLMELLFYSSQNGARRLWGVLLVTAQTFVYEAG
ncbi:MAG: hypothetical protein RLZZ490_1998 [Cyanobacteriota bacterium]